jgi:hypothetical protein
MNEYRIVTVRRDDLEAYMNEYHQNHVTGNCKADGQPWPCDIYKRLRAALDGK